MNIRARVAESVMSATFQVLSACSRWAVAILDASDFAIHREPWAAGHVQVSAAMDEQKQCPNCGEPIGDSDVVCPHCGETLVGG
jgi:hypothetical protein